MDDTPQFLTGKLLIAMPGMQDPRFERSVILMCSHSEREAMGLIINKPVEDIKFDELLHKYNLIADTNMPPVPVMFGGPVELNRGFFLHSPDYHAEDNTHEVATDIALTADDAILHAIAAGNGPRQCLLALGYAGWDEGQIESEIRDNSWIHCDADPALIFETKTNAIWSKALAKLGVDLSGLTGTSGHA